MSKLRPVVLSGGSGTRLWPLSTPDMPKQFVPLVEGQSLFELTLLRLQGIEDTATPIIVTGSAHVDLVEQAMIAIGGVGHVLVEPIGRNTAPAAIAAALIADSDDILVILPSDHLIADVEGFREGVDTAAVQAAAGGIVTFGVHPTRPETGYGYIEIGASLGDGTFRVERFKEKPDPDEALVLVADGRHFWNSGMFVAAAGQFLDEAQTHCPGVVQTVSAALPETHGTLVVLGDDFAEAEAISIDYAIMERTERALVIPIDVGWDDVGSYDSLHAALDRDEFGNHIEGDVVIRDVSGSFIRASSRVVAVAGLSDVVVVETPDAVLVVPLDRSQEVRDLSGRNDRD